MSATADKKINRSLGSMTSPTASLSLLIHSVVFLAVFFKQRSLDIRVLTTSEMGTFCRHCTYQDLGEVHQMVSVAVTPLHSPLRSKHICRAPI